MLPKTQYGFFMLFFIPINRKKSILVGPGGWREPVEPAWKLERGGGREGEVGVLLHTAKIPLRVCSCSNWQVRCCLVVQVTSCSKL